MGLFNSCGVAYKPAKDVDLSPTSSEFYLKANVKAPLMIGVVVKIFAWVLEMRILGKLLLYVLKANNLIYKLVGNAEIEESPVFFPSHPVEEKESEEVKLIDLDLSETEQVQEAVSCLPAWSEREVNSLNPSFHRWTIMDYSRAYHSKKTTPLTVAERFIAAVSESSKPPFNMSFFINYDVEDIMKQAAESTKRYELGN